VKSSSIALLMVAGLCVSSTVLAADDVSALAKSSGCLNCHAVDATKKVGPGFKSVAEKYKGKADAEATLVAKVGEAKGHPTVKASKEDVQKLVKWVLETS
jgi:cytochrome c